MILPLVPPNDHSGSIDPKMPADFEEEHVLNSQLPFVTDVGP